MEAALDLVRLSIDTEGANCSKREVFEFAKAIANTTILNAPTYGLQWLWGDSEEYEGTWWMELHLGVTGTADINDIPKLPIYPKTARGLCIHCPAPFALFDHDFANIYTCRDCGSSAIINPDCLGIKGHKADAIIVDEANKLIAELPESLKIALLKYIKEHNSG